MAYEQPICPGLCNLMIISWMSLAQGLVVICCHLDDGQPMCKQVIHDSNLESYTKEEIFV